MIANCALCQKHNRLLKSHIIPAFVFRWLISSGTPMRSAQNINKRQQDGIKEYMLCNDCEQLFSRYERDFNNRFFEKIINSKESLFSYDQYLINFCASITWRNIKHALKNKLTSHLNELQLSDIVDAEAHLRGFLLKERANPGRFEQHIYRFFPITGTVSPNIPDNINRFLLRHIILDIAAGENFSCSLVKIGPVLIMGVITPPKEKLVSTRLHIKSGVIEPDFKDLPISVWHHLTQKAKDIKNKFSELSENQANLIDENVIRNIEKFRHSQQVEAMMYDVILFGEEAIVRHPK